MSRSADDLTLALLRLRTGGLTTKQIAAKTGLSDGYIRSITNKVLAADAAESGEDVAGAYWPAVRPSVLPAGGRP